MGLSTNGVVISDAMRFVQNSRENENFGKTDNKEFRNLISMIKMKNYMNRRDKYNKSLFCYA
jgi:hypothetical protein